MPTVTSHKPGSFCWVDLATTDAVAAKKFYMHLFGWTGDDNPIGNGIIYTILKSGGKDIGALYNMDKQLQGTPAQWKCYVAVSNVDEIAKKVEPLGGKLTSQPFDVFDAGRMAWIFDPTGAKLALWQAKKHAGASVINEPGAMCWNELGTNDGPSATKFYSQLFGWGTKALPVSPPYTVFSNAGTDIGGMYLLAGPMEGIPPHWLPYFQVHDCDATVSKAMSMGGKTIVPPMDIPVGRFAYVQDPHGAVFAVIKLNPR
ncbi:MAG: VOC family protein [Ignavibacteriae bacterium]|nr:VOC family protein [Ignavibacteria bacterium]MBI3363729.1 VOC family protein [Ignavibacteriota bacterium]